MIQQIVLDTNVIVSALLSPQCNPAKVLKMVVSGELLICHNSQIFSEYHDVLVRPKLKINREDSLNVLDMLFRIGMVITPTFSAIPLPDEADRIFYDTAKACGAALVTGNQKHFPQESWIVTPPELIVSMQKRHISIFCHFKKIHGNYLTVFIQYSYTIGMFITRESDYGVRIIRELSDGSRKTVQDICAKEQVPFQYGYKILKKLEKSGLVQGFRGVSGGYALAKSTDEMTLFDVVAAVDENLLITECLSQGYKCPMNRRGKKHCGVHIEFARIQAQILASLKEKNLTEIL
jgi:putative PIN family toxin of toxin-antitoxin system